MKQRILIVLATLVALVVGALIAAALIWPMVHEVETGKTAEYPEIQPQYYTTDPLRVFEEARAGARALPGWTIVAEDTSRQLFEAQREFVAFGLVDDITVRVEPVTEFVTRVHLRSRSHLGKGDFGQNARNIREFFQELDRRLGAVKLDPDTLRAKSAAAPEKSASKAEPSAAANPR